MEENEIHIKIVLLGNPNVGKSSVIYKYVTGNVLEDPASTVNAKFMGKVIQMQGKNLKLNIWDTAGEERFGSFSKLYCRDAGAAVMIFDLSCPDSFDGMKYWYESMSRTILPEKTHLFIVGNKSDLVGPEVDIETQAKSYATSIFANYFRVSAYSGDGINDLFLNIAEKYLDSYEFVRRDSVYLVKKKTATTKKKKKFC